MKISNYDLYTCRPFLKKKHSSFNSLAMIPKRQTLVLSKLYSNSLFYYALCFQDISDPVNNVKVCTDNSAEHWIKNIAIFTDVQISEYGILCMDKRPEEKP